MEEVSPPWSVERSTHLQWHKEKKIVYHFVKIYSETNIIILMIIR